MTDPFIPHGMAGVHQELQRLRNENRQLRLELTKLKMQRHGLCRNCQGEITPTVSTPTAGPTSWQSGAKDAPDQRREASSRATGRGQQNVAESSASSAATASRAALHRIQSEMEQAHKARAAAEAQVQKTRAELKSLSAHFELFINEVAEREEAYRVVHCGIYDELEESKQQSELLRQQLCEGQERMAQLERSAATAAAASVAVAMGNYSPAVHASEGKAYCIAPEQKTKRSVQRSALPAARSRSDSTHRQGRAASRVKDTAMPHSRLLDSSEVSTVDNVGMRAIDSLLKEELSKESTFMTPHTSGEANEQDTAGVDGATGVSKGVTQTQPNMIHSYSPIGSDKNATSATTTTTTAGAVSNAHDRLRLNVFDIPPPRTVTGAVPKTSLHIVKGAGALRSNRTHGGGGARTTTLAKRRRRDDDAYSTSYEKEKSAVAPETPLHTADSRAANIAAATMNHPDSSDAVERTVCCVPNTAAVTKNTDMTDLAGSSCDAHAAHLARVSPPNKDGTAVRACKHTAVRKRESAETGKVATESCRSLSGNSSTHSTSHPSRCATDSRRRTGSRRAASSVNSDQGHPYSLPASSLFARFQSAQQSAASPSASMQNDASGTERTSVAPNRATGAILVSEPSSSRAMGAATWAVNWSAHIHFGADPIADFLTLADSTHVSAHRDKLRRELMLHCRTVTRVAAYATRYFMHTVRVHARVLLSGDKSIAVGQTPKTCATTAESSAESATPVTGVTAIESTAVGATMISLLELWQRVRHIIDVDQTTMYHALCISLTRQLVKLVQSRRSSDCRLDDLSLARPFVNDPAGKEQGGTDSAAVLALSRIRTLALALRFTWVHGVALHLTRYTSHSGMTRRQQQQHHPKFDGHADIVSSVQDRLSQTTIELAVSMLRGRHAAHHTHDMHSPRLRAEGTNSAGAESSCHSGCSNPDSVTDSCMLSHCGAGASEPEDSADRMRPRTPRVASASKMCVVSGSDALLGQRWMTAMYALCGFDAEVHSLMQYLNLTAAAQACVLTRSLSHFAVQGIFCRMLGASPVVCAETDEDGTSGMAAMCCPGEAPVCEESHLIDHSVNSKHTTRTDHITCTSPIEGDAHGRSADTYSNKSSFTCNGESNEKRNGCSANSMAGCNEMWCDLCASLQWSAHAIPLNAVGQAAVRILTRVGVVDTHTSCPAPDRLDALLALRLLVLYRGVDYLHNLRAQLSPLQRTVHVDADTIFAELCSFAVLDFGMCDVRYAPGQQMAAFLDDYLHAGRNETDLPTCINTTNTQDDGDESSESANNTSSNRVMQSRDKNRAGRQASDSASVASATRILVLRALVQLCQDTRSEDSLTYLARAMRWMRQSASAVTPTREVVDSLRDTALHGALHSSHVQEKTSLLRRTLIGKQLLRLVERVVLLDVTRQPCVLLAMVFLVVKGTTYPDEFVVERRLSDVCDPLASQNASFSPNAITPQTDGSPCLIRPHANTADVQQQHCANNSTSTSLDTNPGQTDSADQTSIVPVICHMQNMRHVLRLMLLSARDLAKCVALPNSRQDSKGVMHGHDDNSSCVEVVMNAQCDADENVPASAGVDAERAMESKASVPRPTGAATVQVQSNQDETAAMQRSTSCHDTTVQDTLTRYNALIDVIETHLKDKSIPVSRESWYDEVATQLRELTAALFPDLCCHENGTAEAIDALSGLLDNPDLDEDRRLLVYHCRAILDPQLRARELQAEQTACLWFAGKPMSGTLARYGGRNEKSKIIVKIAPYGGPAPSQEPRMRYEHQRALFHWRAVKREELATLGESELRARVTAQARGRVLLPTKSDKTANVDIHTDRIRPLGGRSENVRL